MLRPTRLLFALLVLAGAASSTHAVEPLRFAAYWSLQGAQNPPAQQAPAQKRTITSEDIPQWESLGPSAISNDGRWFACTINKVDADGYLALRNCDTPDRAVTPLGTMPRFSDDSKWLAYGIGLPKKEADKLREEKKPVEMKLGLRNLANGQETIYESIQSWAFTKGGGSLVMLRYRAASRTSGGSDLIIRNMVDGTTMTIGNVMDMRLHKNGKWLALGIDSGGQEKGLQVYEFETGKVRDILFSKATIANVGWAEEADALGFLAGTQDPKKEGPWNVVYRVSGFGTPNLTVATFDPAKLESFPKGMRIAEFGGLQWNEKGDIAAFGIKEWEDKKTPEGKPEDKPNVDVWHYKDFDLQPYQQRMAEMEKRRTYLCMWRSATNTFTQIGSEKVKDVSLLRGFNTAIWEDPEPYKDPTRPGGIDYSDYYVIDTLNGHKTRFLEKRQFGPVPSRDGKYIAYFAQKAWWVYEIGTGKLTNVTQGTKRDFWDVEDDHTVKEKPAEGFPVWFEKGGALVVYDKYDAFLYDPATGKTTQLTDGKNDKLVYRLMDPGYNEDGLDAAFPMYFRVFGEMTKKSGYYRREADGKGKLLVLDDIGFGGLRKAKDTDRMVFTMQSFEKSPAWFLTNEVFAQSKPLVSTNPQQKDFLWGKTELIDYKSKWGKPLQGVLVYPAGYEKGKTYPMVTYIYERMSDGLNNYAMPSDTNPYSTQYWSQNGYFVLLPDIAYRDRNPGKSAVECLEPAVQAAIATKAGVEPTKVGLVGHSWGGYQAAYVPTQSKMFAAAVAGAPLTELISMYNSFYWNAGITDQVIFESSQGRMEVPWYEDVKAYTDNSPVWQAKNLNTPMLITFGDSDGAVDWHQGQQYYNTLRRMGKPVIMLVYPGENHGLAKKPNQKDYAHRVRHFFDVYLKGAKPEKWITDGVPAVKKGEEEKPSVKPPSGT